MLEIRFNPKVITIKTEFFKFLKSVWNPNFQPS